MKVEQTTGMRLGRSKPFRVLIITILAVLAMMVFASPGSAVDYNVIPGESIQTAIDSAAPGDTISVAAGSYSGNININKSLTLSGAGAASTTIAGTGGTAVTISANDVTIDGFTITNPSGKSGIVATDRSNITISNNIVDDIGSSDASASGTNLGIAIVCSSAAVDSINITGNQVSNIAGGSFKSADGIAVGWSTGTFNVTNLLIQNNTISGITSATDAYVSGGRGAYGIILNHARGTGGHTGQTVAPQVLDNDISNLEGLWSHGIGLEGNTPNALVQGNTIDNLVDHKSPADPDAAAIMVEDNLSADTVTITGNGFTNTWLGLRNATSLAVNASGNWWDTADPATKILNAGGGSVDFSPWMGAAPGTSPMTWTTNDSIQEAIDAASAGDTINIAAGTYVENVTVNKSVELAGAGQGSTIIKPATSLPNPCAGSSTCGPPITNSSNVVVVQANNVVIHDLTVDGDNPALTSGIVRNGADLDARNGIITNHHAGVFSGTEIYDVTVRNIYLRGIYPSSGGSFNIHDNTVHNVRGDSGSIAIMAWMSAGTISGNTISEANDGIAANHSKGIQFLNNTVTNSGSGVHTDNAGDGGGVADLLQGNNVSDCDLGGYGVWTFVPYIAPVVDNNTVTNCAVGLSAWGGGSSGPLVTTQFTNNIVNGPAKAAGSVGAYITTDTIGWGYADIAVNFTGNVISGNETGIYMTADEQSWNPSYTARTITATFSGNEIAGNTVGMDKGTGGTINADAVGNWWGDASGPYNAASNASGTGNSIADGIPFISWLGMAPVSPVVTYQGPTGDVHVSNPVVTATTTGGSAGDLIVQLGVSGQLDPANPWDVTMWTFPCTVTGGDISCSTSGLPEGVFTATVTVIDSKGLTGNDTGSFTVDDNAAPVTTDDAPAGWVNTDVTVTLTCTDAVTGCAQTTYEVDGGSTQVGNTVVLSAEGVHTITYRSVDNDDPAHVES
ncbi:MAG: right-handed parallel beta-helix repeat-containing protein, partial [Thermoleophilia bacterium]